jgi:hypothetical protein
LPKIETRLSRLEKAGWRNLATVQRPRQTAERSRANLVGEHRLVKPERSIRKVMRQSQDCAYPTDGNPDRRDGPWIAIGRLAAVAYHFDRRPSPSPDQTFEDVGKRLPD